MNEANRALAEAQRSFSFNPADLEKSEERLFALRAAARKHKCTVDALAATRERFEKELATLTDGGQQLAKLEARTAAAQKDYDKAADLLSAARKKVAKNLDKAVQAELPPLKLEKARFETQITSDAGKPGPHGIDRVEFVVAANPGTPLSPLMKVASGGELARFMLALKVILAAKGSAPTLIFDEIDTGVGGAVADAIGGRLARMAQGPAGSGGYPFTAGGGAGQRAHADFKDGRSGQPPHGDTGAIAVGEEPARGSGAHAVGRAGDR